MFENFKKITIKGGCFDTDTELELFKKNSVGSVSTSVSEVCRLQGCGAKLDKYFHFNPWFLKKITNFVLRLDEETGSAGEQPVSNKAAPTLKAVNEEGRL